MSHFVHTCSCCFIGLCSNWQVASGDSIMLLSVVNTQVCTFDKCQSKLIIFDVFSTVHYCIQLFHQPTLMHHFLYSLTIFPPEDGHVNARNMSRIIM